MGGGAVISHRGEEGPDAPENSLAAFRVAMDAGLPIELDIVLTQDHAPIVFHDARLDRLTDRSGWVARQSFEQVRAATLSNGEPIHTLAEVMDLVDGQVPLVIDIKPQLGIRGADVARAVSREIEQRPYYEGRLATQSFSPTYLRKMRELSPSVPRGQLSYFIEDLALIPFSRPDFLATDFKSMRVWLGVRRGLGLPLLGWGVAEQDLARSQSAFDSVIADVETHKGRDLPTLKEAFTQVRTLLDQATLGELSVIEALEDSRAALMQSDTFQDMVKKIDRVLGNDKTPPAARDMTMLFGELSQDLDKIEQHVSLADDAWFKAGQKFGRTVLKVLSFFGPAEDPANPDPPAPPPGLRPWM